MPRKNILNFDHHTIDLCKAAIPYVNNNAQSSMNVLIKATELADTVQELREPPDLSACDMGQEQVDPEVLLTNIRPVCNESEAQFVDTILNFMNARKIYSAYQEYQNMMTQAQSMNDQTQTQDQSQQNNQSQQQSNNPFGFNQNASPMDFLLSQLSPEQRSTFETLSMMMSSMPTG